ncbi:Fungal Zn(2)-Cys(6) binuclear cluster domain [Ceratobasidium sp. AG-Ba]|nr:Fungal Zn(2)-Cys(6) binuclear cluster domain [Ceratobasidium sp. AG-Ba]
MPQEHPTGRPRCTACVAFRAPCRRQLPRCSSCVRHDRECVYEAQPDENPQDLQLGEPAGIRRPRSTPTVDNWGPQDHPAALDAQSSSGLSSLLSSRQGGEKRRRDSSGSDSIGHHVRRAQELRDELRRELQYIGQAGGNTVDIPQEAGAVADVEPRRHTPSVAATNAGVIPGFQAGAADVPPPPAIKLHMMRGWSHHFSLSTLVDDYCHRVHTGRIMGKTLPGSGSVNSDFIDPSLLETELSYDQWTQAWRRLLQLIQEFFPDLFPLWKAHYDFVNSRPNRPTLWKVWLAYDIYLRMATRSDPRIDMSVFQREIWDSVLTRYLTDTAAVVHAQADPRMHMPGALPVSRVGVFGVVTSCPKNIKLRSAMQLHKSQVGQSLSSELPKATGSLMGNLSATSTTVPMVPATGFDASTKIVDTSAPCVVPLATEPSDATRDPRRVVTPLLPEAWKVVLEECDLLSDFADVPLGLSQGFPIGSSNMISRTSVPVNHRSALDNPAVVEASIQSELAAGRYTGPYSKEALEALIGPFRSAPLGVVEKSTPGEFRIIQDFSYPRSGSDHPSLNAEIDPDAYSCEWGFFEDVVRLVLSAPPGAEAATLDVDAAYRRMPVKPADQHNTIISWNNRHYVDHCVPFGAVSSNGIFGRCGDAMARICRAKHLGPVVKWVDDFLFFRAPAYLDSNWHWYSTNDIIELARRLGWPWKLSKTKDFAAFFTYLGFLWSIPERSVRIPDNKREKYLRRCREWLSSTKVSLEQTEKLVGSLSHCTLIVRNGCPHLAGLYAFAAAFPNKQYRRWAWRHPTDRARADAEWWMHTLEHSTLCLSLREPWPEHHTPIFMDASTSFGIGIIVEGCVAAWKLTEGWKRPGVDIGWAEMAAVELALVAVVAKGVQCRTVLLRSDNRGVVFAVRSRQSRNVHQNEILLRILLLAETHNLDLRIDYIRSADNPADCPSRGLPAPGSQPITWAIHTPPQLAPFLCRVGP